MLSGKRFALKRSTLAIDLIDGKRMAVSVPAGATIEVLPGSTNGDITVEVLWDGRRVVMFAVDVTERSSEITKQKANPARKDEGARAPS